MEEDIFWVDEPYAIPLQLQIRVYMVQVMVYLNVTFIYQDVLKECMARDDYGAINVISDDEFTTAQAGNDDSGEVNTVWDDQGNL